MVKINSTTYFISFVVIAILFSSMRTALIQPTQTNIFLIGDSTVRNQSGTGGAGQWGWGTFLQEFFDSTEVVVHNHAMAGRSTRTFIKEGRWDSVLESIKPGDFVIMQFGHNEGSDPDTTRSGYRGVLPGIGYETKSLTWPDGTQETVHTYGWYLMKFIQETKAKGAYPIVASMIPRNKFHNDNVERANKDFGLWAKEAARKAGASFIDLNSIVADQYDNWGPQVVQGFFEKDHTHTNEAGARINAWSVIKGLQTIENKKLQALLPKRKPRLLLVGDSTVKNGQGDGAGGLWGWGDFIAPFFDREKISVENHALGGTSSRTFQTYGNWQKVVDRIEPGDFVIIQFGHNDSGPLDDEARARGTIKGSGLEAEFIFNPITKRHETVYSYGQYLRNMISDTQAKGATPIVCSPIPRNNWNEEKVYRSNESYGKWAKEAATGTNAIFIDLNDIISNGYDSLGSEYVSSHYFNDQDHTHTILKGAKFNAEALVKGIKDLENSTLHSFLK
ncbi:rhamnogalacturonan acetylesterase [Belliella kenyensis]|uniref:Rhamnogalacturonan acetylesterase n=1 Tax=Belliella kenyensis TaxID=1472724 RepID=A0ABV8EI42_9BACT|nr:rhamnogalacturonan acetylesterase [Belliella kenyensis]MCH7401862.1 rhamnogalacturonan acetylesterase [Belliella kenyensis]MDN3604362.1 rhamnogalacturonan acetylesterase [Belliella kenyensis]